MKGNFPKWLEKAVFYEIYPQSFCDTNSDGIGDLQGIIDKLDYICDTGFNALWLNPIFSSPFGDAGYDISDYYTVAKRYGTNEDAKRLFSEAHKRNMHIFLDLVPGHTAPDHKWFCESMKAQTNEYTDRYIWNNDVWEMPKGFGCIRGISDRDGCAVVNFFSHQPALNYGFYEVEEDWQQPIDAKGPTETLNAIIDVMRFWLDMGCDGFRVDMAGAMVKNDPEQLGTIKLWQKVRKFLDAEYPDAAIISEWGNPERAIGGGFHLDFCLHFGYLGEYENLFRTKHPFFCADGKGDITEFVEKYTKAYEKTKENGYICMISGNHDLQRMGHYLSDTQKKLAFAMLLSMPGAPFVYYGDEIGMDYIEGMTSHEGGFFRTGSRTPMQWDDTPNAGFSSAPSELLYLPIDKRKDRPTVKKQLSLENSLLSEVKRLIKLRKENPALANGAEFKFETNTYPLVYSRWCKEQKLKIIINPQNKPFKVKANGRIIYKNGEATFNGEICTIGKESVAFIEL